MNVLELDIPGLDLVLDGGIRILERMPGAGESASILIRGPAGSGKTTFGTQIAASIARKLNTDVAYGCIELLPVELQAQHDGVRRDAQQEKVIVLSESPAGLRPPYPGVRIYAGLLDIGDSEQAASRLGEALEALLAAANDRAGGKVRVFVIDSLSDGYGLGAQKASRILADEVCKLAAQRGLVAVLLEETGEVRPSVWSFAVDTVFELGPAERGTPFDPQLLVPKNRLGPADPGPHRFRVVPHGGVVVEPREVAYTRPWSLNRVVGNFGPLRVEQAWGYKDLDELGWLPPFQRSTIAVVGPMQYVQRVVETLGRTRDVSPKAETGPELWYSLGHFGTRKPGEHEGQVRTFGLGPTRTGASFLAQLRRNLEEQWSNGHRPPKVVIGDLRALDYSADADGMRWAVATAGALLKDLGVPCVLYESVEQPGDVSSAVHMVDVIVTCSKSPSSTGVVLDVQNAHTGRRALVRTDKVVHSIDEE
jgi:KaiC/GvpD/RAD55 family RecA-like ATPase